ncbi:MAG: hypothetical protein HY204_03205 [Nitrospirae bacterium]|nr:hypothetical protein [Nitrospirota bacterium]
MIITIALLSLTFIQAHCSFTTSAEGAALPPVTQDASDSHVYKLRVKDHRLAFRTIKDLVSLLDGTTRSRIVKKSRPETIRLDLSLPQEQSAYFLSKLSGLGNLTPPTDESSGHREPQNGRIYSISIDIFDP